ncbi:hypothetical protein [Rhizorhabdus argentea]|uniref:hypothetical protein n=1 Tax=Rhizorhabdus argentea TaxID=1387174 RepID=UPI0030EB7BDC
MKLQIGQNGGKGPVADITAQWHDGRMLSFVRSPWFAIIAVSLLVLLGLLLPSERLWLFGLAGAAAFWGLIDWVGAHSEDSGNVR